MKSTGSDVLWRQDPERLAQPPDHACCRRLLNPRETQHTSEPR